MPLGADFITHQKSVKQIGR